MMKVCCEVHGRMYEVNKGCHFCEKPDADRLMFEMAAKVRTKRFWYDAMHEEILPEEQDVLTLAQVVLGEGTMYTENGVLFEDTINLVAYRNREDFKRFNVAAKYDDLKTGRRAMMEELVRFDASREGKKVLK